MIILDTNVVSEPLKPSGNPRVQAWLDDQVAETLFLTTTSLSELLVGVELLPDGRRKLQLRTKLNEFLTTLFGSRILAFDQQAAMAYAPLVVRARSAGRVLSAAHAQIAAIAFIHGFSVATRDEVPFIAAGVQVIDPWQV